MSWVTMCDEFGSLENCETESLAFGVCCANDSGAVVIPAILDHNRVVTRQSVR